MPETPERDGLTSARPVAIGSLFSGYRGLDMAVESVTGGATVWCSDIDAGANKVLAHHWPDVPNLGDITGEVVTEPVDAELPLDDDAPVSSEPWDGK